MQAPLLRPTLRFAALAGELPRTILGRLRVGTTSLKNYSARDIRILCDRDAVDWLWRSDGERRRAFNGLRGRPLVQPVCRLLAAKVDDNWSHGHKGFLRSLLADAWWGSDACPLCQSGGWSVWHALWECPAIQEFSYNHGFPEEVL